MPTAAPIANASPITAHGVRRTCVSAATIADAKSCSRSPYAAASRADAPLAATRASGPRPRNRSASASRRSASVAWASPIRACARPTSPPGCRSTMSSCAIKGCCAGTVPATSRSETPLGDSLVDRADQPRCEQTRGAASEHARMRGQCRTSSVPARKPRLESVASMCNDAVPVMGALFHPFRQRYRRPAVGDRGPGAHCPCAQFGGAPGRSALRTRSPIASTRTVSSPPSLLLLLVRC